MKREAAAILKDALALPTEARAALAGLLLESLDTEVDEDAEAVWATEINRRVADPPALLAAVEAEHRGKAKISHLDGLLVEYPDWWFNLRPSNTEPVLRLNLEAHDRAVMERERDRLVARMDAAGTVLRN